MMLKFSRFSACLLTGLLAAGAVAASGTAASASTLSSCKASGANANCAVAVPVKSPGTITVTVNSSPHQSVIVAWIASCSLGSSTKQQKGTFTATTPVTRVLPHPFARPDQCVFGAAGELTGSGAVTVTLAAAHVIKGFANLCASVTGTKVETAACNYGAAEQWAFSHGKLVHGGACMTDKGNAGNGGKVVLSKCTGAASQAWTHNSRQEYVLRSHGGTLCLTDPGSSKRAGTQLVVATCRNTASQHWTLP
jgi:ricin-type beta-trefoil lectin protein